MVEVIGYLVLAAVVLVAAVGYLLVTPKEQDPPDNWL